jgi:type VI secretion system protein ImpC
MSGQIDFLMNFGGGGSQPRKSDRSYRLYVIGHFSGQTNQPWAERNILKIDTDHFESVFAKLAPQFVIPRGYLTLNFKTPDDLHPDRWLPQVPLLAEFEQLKHDLGQPDKVQSAIQRIQQFVGAPENRVNLELPEDSTPAIESDDSILQRLLGQSAEQKQSPVHSTVDQWLHNLMAPYIKHEIPECQMYRDILDQLNQKLLKTLLLQPGFRQLEALWRATEDLVNEELADEQSIYLVDLAPSEWLQFNEADHQRLTDKIQQHLRLGDDEQDVLILTDLLFHDQSDSLALLQACQTLAEKVNAYFLAGIDASLLQALTEISKKQNNAQVMPDSCLLTYPRYLQRLPYGLNYEPIDKFAFEESSVPPQNIELLWSSSAFILARALMRMQEQEATFALQFNDIPVFSFDDQGESRLQPATEQVLTEPEANAILSAGLIPLIGFHQRQGLRLLLNRT